MLDSPGVSNTAKGYVCKDGGVLLALLNATVFHDAEDRPAYAVSTIWDISAGQVAGTRRLERPVAEDMPLPEMLGQLAAAVKPENGGQTRQRGAIWRILDNALDGVHNRLVDRCQAIGIRQSDAMEPSGYIELPREGFWLSGRIIRFGRHVK